MRSLTIAAVLCLLLLPVFSCSKKEVKQISPDSRMFAEAQGVLESIRVAYVSKDLQSVQIKATRDGFRTLTSSVKSFDSVELEFNPVLAEIEGKTVQVNVSWKGRWTYAGRTTDERGMAVFVLKGQPLQLDSILRANPFVYP